MIKKIFISAVIINILIVFCFGEEIDTVKVNEYMNKIEDFIKRNPDIQNYGDNSPQALEWLEIMNTYKLNDSEFIKVQDTLTKDEDIMEISEGWFKGDSTIQFNQNILNKYWIFHLTETHQKKEWEKKNLSNETILTERILPIISNNNNPVVTRAWIMESYSLLLDINNEQLPLDDNKRNKICDKFIDIFNDKAKNYKLRIKAIEAWTAGEIRKEEIIRNVDNISKEKNLFKETAYYFYKGRRTPQEVTDKILLMLEESDKYPEEVNEGVMAFLSRATGTDDILLKSRIKKVLNNKLFIEKNGSNKNKYNNILKSIELHEKRKGK